MTTLQLNHKHITINFEPGVGYYLHPKEELQSFLDEHPEIKYQYNHDAHIIEKHVNDRAVDPYTDIRPFLDLLAIELHSILVFPDEDSKILFVLSYQGDSTF